MQRQERCEACKLAGTCPCLFLFESPQHQKSRHKWKTAHEPHPFVLEPPLDEKRAYLPGNLFCVGLTLIGEGISYLPYFILVFEEMGAKGIGHERGRFSLTRVTAAGPAGEQEIYCGNDQFLRDDPAPLTPAFLHKQVEEKTTEVAVDFLTPTRLQQRGRPVNRIEFPLLIRALLRRYSWLAALYCHDILELPHDLLLELAAKEVRLVYSDLVWQELERYSFRQRQKLKLGCVVGRAVFAGNLEPFLLLLKLGEYLHIGKGTAYGLGKYQMTRPHGVHSRPIPCSGANQRPR